MGRGGWTPGIAFWWTAAPNCCQVIRVVNLVLEGGDGVLLVKPFESNYLRKLRIDFPISSMAHVSLSYSILLTNKGL